MSSFANRVRQFAYMGKPVIEIALGSEPRGQQSCFVTSLGTLDSITGRAYITAPQDTKFDSVEIAFKGFANTFVERIATVSAVNSRQQGIHGLLSLTQPGVDHYIPEDKILREGQTYEIPFEFVVPSHLPDHSCTHTVNNTKIRDMHLLLPPSLGDPEVAGAGKSLLDDMAPEMSRISYAIVVRVQQSKIPTIMAEKYRKIRVMPATEELPPVDVDGQDSEYCLRREKALKKHGLLGTKLGRVVGEAMQPASLSLPPPNVDLAETCSVSTMATVMLRFDPTEDTQPPPRLGTLASKLSVSTYFASEPLRDFPCKAKMLYDSRQGVVMDSLHLSSRTMESVHWERHDGTAAVEEIVSRRGSTLSMAGTTACPQPTKNYKLGTPFYTAQLLIPVNLPKNKCFVPTFYSCLISRTYTLELSLSMSMRSGGPGLSTTVDLKLPVQISSQASGESRERQASIEQETEASVDAFFTPRNTISWPPASNRETFGEAPPDYSFHARVASTVPVCG